MRIEHHHILPRNWDKKTRYNLIPGRFEHLQSLSVIRSRKGYSAGINIISSLHHCQRNDASSGTVVHLFFSDLYYISTGCSYKDHPGASWVHLISQHDANDASFSLRSTLWCNWCSSIVLHRINVGIACQYHQRDEQAILFGRIDFLIVMP